MDPTAPPPPPRRRTWHHRRSRFVVWRARPRSHSSSTSFSRSAYRRGRIRPLPPSRAQRSRRQRRVPAFAPGISCVRPCPTRFPPRTPSKGRRMLSSVPASRAGPSCRPAAAGHASRVALALPPFFLENFLLGIDPFDPNSPTKIFFSRSTCSIRTLRLSDRTPDDPKGRELCYWMRSLQIFDHTPDEPNGSELCAIRPRHVRYHRNIADVARSPGHTGANPHRGDRPFSVHVIWSLAR